MFRRRTYYVAIIFLLANINTKTLLAMDKSERILIQISSLSISLSIVGLIFQNSLIKYFPVEGERNFRKLNVEGIGQAESGYIRRLSRNEIFLSLKKFKRKTFLRGEKYFDIDIIYNINDRLFKNIKIIDFIQSFGCSRKALEEITIENLSATSQISKNGFSNSILCKDCVIKGKNLEGRISFTSETTVSSKGIQVHINDAKVNINCREKIELDITSGFEFKIDFSDLSVSYNYQNSATNYIFLFDIIVDKCRFLSLL